MTAWGMAIPCIIQRMCGKRVLPVSSSRAESRGLFRWRQEGERLTVRNGKHPYHGKWKRRVSRIVIGSEVEGSFSLAVRGRASDGEKWETPYRGKAGAVLPVNGLAKKSWKKGMKKISRCARNDSVGDGYPVHHTKNVWEKHVSRIVIGSEVEGSFSLAVRRSVFDSEKRETPHRRKGGDGVSRKRLSEGGGKRGTEKISRCARNDSVGDGYPVHHTKNVWEKHVPRIVIGSGVEGSFSLAVRRSVFDSEEREIPYRGKADGVSRKRLSKGGGKRGRKRFLAAPEIMG